MRTGQDYDIREVCPDCLQAGANGIGDTYADFSEDFKARWEKAGDISLSLMGDSDGYFSKTPCEHCGDTLGGSRFSVVAYGLKTGGEA
jgi:hypothetical protein